MYQLSASHNNFICKSENSWVHYCLYISDTNNNQHEPVILMALLYNEAVSSSPPISSYNCHINTLDICPLELTSVYHNNFVE